MRDFVPGSGFLNSLIGSAAFQTASQQSEMIQNITKAIQQLQHSGAAGKMRDLTPSLNGMAGALTQLKDERVFDRPEVLLNLQRQIDTVYSPVSDIAKQVTVISANWSAMGQGAQLLRVLPQIRPETVQGISKALELYGAGIQRAVSDISVEELDEFCKDEKITPDTVAQTAAAICAEAAEDKLTIPEYLDKVKKTNWYFAFSLLLLLASFFCKPVIDHAADTVLDKTGITSFWEESGVYEWIDQVISELSENAALSEETAKASVDRKSGNLSKQKRDGLLSKISAIRAYIAAAPQDENTGSLLTYLSDLEKAVNGRKYGLVFEEHQEAIDTVLAENIPVLTEEPELLIDSGGEMNFLLEGDNLAALRLLEKTHRGRVKLIYIDPPYNTGNKDFIYNDNIVDGTDTFRHSKWLSFMSSRLQLAKTLLCEQGAIFISVDDNEIAALKMLCDQVFGENNFVANIVVKSNPRGSMSQKEIASLHEYVLVYTKNIVLADIVGHKLTETMVSEYSLSDERGKYRLLGLRQRGGFWRASERPKLFYPFFVSDAGEIALEKGGAYIHPVYPYQPSTGEKGTWRWSREKAESECASLVAKQIKRGGSTTWDIYQKDYMAPLGTERRTKARSIWDEREMNYQNAASELKELFHTSVFTYAKPTYLVMRILEMVGFQDGDWVLDFFAGSGTTGHAVMKLNAEDGGHRKFILCTNNENNICRNVTYERIRRVIEREGYAASLKYYRIDYVPINERLYYEYADELLCHVRELAELENGVNSIENAGIAIVLTDEELEDFTARPEAFGKCHTLYLGYDVLPTGEQDALLKEREIAVRMIPDYYYREWEG